MMTRIEQLRCALKSGESQKISDVIHYLLSATPAVLLPETPDLPASAPDADEDDGI